MRISLAAVVLALITTSSAWAVGTTSVSFQNGVGGYTGTLDMRISTTGTRDGTLGSTVTNYLIDGYLPDNPETPQDDTSPDENNLIRFDNIFGNGAGLIPLGATILDAQLSMTTAGGNGDSPGPWGVAALNQPFTTATRYTDFPGGGPLGFRGAWWQDNYATRTAGGFSQLAVGDRDGANVRSLVQLWSSDPEGDNNHGFVLQAGWPGQTNGWGFNTTGIGNVAARPELSVTYTTDPVEINTFQRDLNGYTGDTMAWVRSGFIHTATGTNPDPSVDDITYDAYTGLPMISDTSTIDPVPTQLTSFQQFLDGPQFTTTPGVLDSADDVGLVKFDNVFGAGEGQSPTDKEVAKAWLVLTTGDANANARSNGTWAAHPMARDWDVTSLYSEDFGAQVGLQQADGDIAAAADTALGMITGSQIWFDVTNYLEAIRTGATDFGLAIMSTGTADGWQIHLNGSPEAEFRPRLVVMSDLAAVVGLAGDYNDDGTVDAADYVVWRRTDGSPSGYNTWRANFGMSSPGGGSSIEGGAVPEPATLALGLITCVAFLLTNRKRQ